MCTDTMLMNGFPPTEFPFISLGKSHYCSIYYGHTHGINQIYLKTYFLKFVCIPNPECPDPASEETNVENIYFHSSLWYFKHVL